MSEELISPANATDLRGTRPAQLFRFETILGSAHG